LISGKSSSFGFDRKENIIGCVNGTKKSSKSTGENLLVYFSKINPPKGGQPT